MPFCPNCGATVEGRFCAKCGTPVTGGGTVSGSGANPPSAASAAPMADNVASALCYALGLITGILFLVIAPYNQTRTVRFHAFQSIFLHVGVIACYIALSFILGFLHVFAFILIWPLIGL